MKITPQAENRILLQLDNGETIDINDGTGGGKRGRLIISSLAPRYPTIDPEQTQPGTIYLRFGEKE